MSLKEQINQDLKLAMKAKDKLQLDVLRMVKAAIQGAEIEKKEALTAEEEMTILAREAKQRTQSIAEFIKAGRQELVDKTQAELAILQTYLPKQLTAEEVTQAIAAKAQAIGAETKADFGKLMGQVMQDLKGQADGGLIRDLVKAYLEGK